MEGKEGEATFLIDDLLSFLDYKTKPCRSFTIKVQFTASHCSRVVATPAHAFVNSVLRPQVSSMLSPILGLYRRLLQAASSIYRGHREGIYVATIIRHEFRQNKSVPVSEAESIGNVCDLRVGRRTFR